MDQLLGGLAGSTNVNGAQTDRVRGFEIHDVDDSLKKNDFYEASDALPTKRMSDYEVF